MKLQQRMLVGLGGPLLGLTLIMATPARAQTSIEEIRMLWQTGSYAAAFADLTEYRKQPYGKTFEVYYMAGTSLCRISGTRDLGVRYLQWILDNYNLDPDARRTVESERGICEAASTAKPVLISFNTTAATAGVSGSTKMFYFVDRENALRSVPVEVIEEIPLEVLKQRLFLPGDSAAAIRNASELVKSAATIEATDHFVLASVGGRHSQAELRRMGAALDRTFAFFVGNYGMRPPKHLITVYLVSSSNELQRLSRSLHGIAVAPQSLGYSYRDDMSMVGFVPTTAIGTLNHELFHLLVRNDFGDVPPWMDEGLAALYEVSEASGDSVRGVPNWRGRVLRELWSEAPTAEALVRMNWLEFSSAEDVFATAEQAANHAKARYFMLFLQERDQLTAVYRAFQERQIGSEPATLLESVLKEDLQSVEQDFENWFESLPNG